MGQVTPRHKTQAGHPVLRAIFHEAKEWGFATLFWFGIASPFLAVGLLGALGALIWVGAIVGAVLCVAFAVMRNSRSQLNDPAWQAARTRQWYMGDPLPALPSQVRWDEFEQMLERDLKDDPWKPMDNATQTEFLRIASREKPVPGEPVPGYTVLPPGHHAEYIYVDQRPDPVMMVVPDIETHLLPAGQVPPVPTNPTELFSMICSKCGVHSVPRSTGRCLKCDGVMWKGMSAASAQEAMRLTQQALRQAYAVPGERIVPTLKTKMSQQQIEQALAGHSEARRRQLLAHLRKAGYVQ